VISIENVSKTYGKVQSLAQVSATVGDGSIFGLIGSNGSGKSTLLRIMSGAMRPDEGQILYDGRPIYESPAVKDEVLFLSDEQFQLGGASLNDMQRLYASVYKNFDMERYHALCDLFHLEADRKLSTFSKGMKKQASILLALSCRPRYLLCDETFDGLDPVMRKLVKRLLAEEVATGNLTPIIASHNLREIEDICDHIGLLHGGSILFERELDDMKRDIHTVQAVFDRVMHESLFDGLSPISLTARGSLYTMVVRGNEEEISAKIAALAPKFFEILPLTLEEIFISEMEERGYDYSKVIF
jgi:ABC-2 type transport system ATP-binding protein